MNLAGTITIKEVYDALQQGKTDLYDKRFSFGRESDVNEFSISLEERGMLPQLPYKLGIEDLYNISKANEDVIENISRSRTDDRKNDSRFVEEPSQEDRGLLKSELQLSYLYSIDDSTKFDNRTNLDIVDIITHQDLYESKTWSYLSKFNDSRYILMNKVTTLDNAYISNRNLNRLNRTRRIGELLKLILSDKLKVLQKSQRPQIYYTSDGIRPDNTQYHKWNGMQVFDLDLKYAKCFKDIHVSEIKQQLFASLCHYKWLIGVGLSSSGNGIHIYTKVARPHHYYIEESQNEMYERYWYRMSFVQKYAAIRWVMENVCHIDNGEDPKHPVIDFAVCKISQGIRVAWDPDFLINPNFEDIQPCVGYHIPPQKGLEIQDWLTTSEITESRIFRMWIEQNEETEKILNGISVETHDAEYEDSEVSIPESGKITSYQGDVYYQLRYNVCNTLAAFFGEEGRQYAHIVLKSEACRNVNEVNGIYNCSLTTKKKPTKFGLQILKQCGFQVKIGKESQELLVADTKKELITLLKRASESINTDNVSLELGPTEYLGHYTDFLLEHFEAGKANLLVSPPGTGKTELVKSLSKEKRVLLVLPYISVIDAKVVRDNDLGENFDAYFGTAKVSDIKKGRSAVMTLDKFGRIDVDKIAYMYDYVMIDESHLIFTSSFRLEAMANSLKNIKQLIEASKLDEFSARVVMMTGTPTGEVPYFGFYKNLNEIQVRKKETRSKIAEFVICSDIRDMQAKIAIEIAECLKKEKKILYPTNAGDVQAVKLVGMIEHQLGRTVKWSYYKKANCNSEMATSINENATIGDYELVLASNYLSVGIDIKDIQDFECIYDASFAGYEIEQFNCRLRNIDIHSKIFIPLYDGDGNILPNLLNYSDFSIKMSREDRDLLRDYVDIAKKKLELSVTYDPITNRIFTPGFRIENGQIIFKLEEHELTMFEERYLDTMRSPYFIATQLAEYGYQTVITDSDVLDKKLTNELIKVGLENAKIESQYKNDLAISTFEWLMDNDNYQNSFGMEYPNLVNRIWKESIEIDEDPNVHSIQVTETMIGEVEKLTVPDRRIFDEQLSIALRFLSLYSVETSKYIYKQCIKESGKINKAEVSRYMRLMQLVKMEERASLGKEIYSLIQYMYSYMDCFTKDPNYFVPVSEHELRVDYCTQIYLSELGLSLRSQKMLKRYRDEVNELINVLCTKTRSESGIRLDFRLLPTPDNATRLKLKQYDSILKQMFEISDDRLPQNLQENIRLRHLPQRDIDALNSIKKVRNGNMSILQDVKPW